ncbi:MAG: glucoamylase family protein, partial [Trueperaceae bacterium]
MQSSPLDTPDAWLEALTVDVVPSGTVPRRLRGRHQLRRLEAFRKRAASMAALERDERASTGREWLLDNHATIERAVGTVREGMRPNVVRRFPRLVTGPLQGRLRPAALAAAVLSLSGSDVSFDLLRALIERLTATRDVARAELWALPALLRDAALARIESVADAMLTPSPSPEAETITANAVRSLLAFERRNWLTFIEAVDPVDGTLRDDPAGVYPRMDFASRDAYRHAVERIARSCGRSEVEVARAAVALARGAASPPFQAGRPEPQPERHVGFYLIDDGRAELMCRVGPPRQAVPSRAVRAWRATAYGVAVGLSTLLLAAPAALLAAGPWLGSVLAAALALFPAAMGATALVHWGLARLVRPRILSRLDPEAGIPAEATTLLVIPAIVANEDDVAYLTRRLELHRASNPDPELYFALLTDFPDADRRSLPGEDALLRALEKRVAELDAQRAADEPQRFFVLHRERRWNPHEGCWMGWERKRGKLQELVDLLHHGRTGSFVRRDPFGADLRRRIRFVATLDADTTLPPGEAARLVTLLAHPLQRARWDASTGRVHRGYTFAQPRLDENPESARASRFRQALAGRGRLDLYHHRVSNALMDLFGQGIYQGKAVFDVDAFAASIAGRLRDDTLLSHDLLEGLLGRAAFVSDSYVLEQEPSTYLAHVRRLERWVRGDWQLLPWLVAPRRADTRSLGVGGRWQLAVPMAASLARPAEMALLAFGWLLSPTAPWTWALLVVGYEALPSLPDVIDRLVHARRPGTARLVMSTLARFAARFALHLAFLAHEAWARSWAVGATMVRMLVTRKRLLQWTTAAEVDRQLAAGGTARRTWRAMAASPTTSALFALALAVARPTALPAAAPLLLAWALAPALAAWTARPAPSRVPEPTRAMRRALRTLARQTWHFFEAHVGPEDGWLPPDHFQEEPLGVVAHRTSPTNIGLYLASCVAASDLGFVGLATMNARVSRAFESMERLERVRGHFLNWYDTSNLDALRPRYVSAVDSGNLLACLIVVRQALLRAPDQPTWTRRRWDGLLDTLAAFRSALGPVSANPADRQVRFLISDMRSAIIASAERTEAWPGLLAALSRRRALLHATMVPLLRAARRRGSGVASLGAWAARVHADIQALRRDVTMFQPWFEALEDAPPVLRGAAPDSLIGRAMRALADLPVNQTPAELPTSYARARDLLGRLRAVSAADLQGMARHGAIEWCDILARAVDEAERRLGETLDAIRANAERSEAFVTEADLRFLFDPTRRVFRLGYRVEDDEVEEQAYDMLASEARTLSLVATALGQVPVDHWLHLARPFSDVGGRRMLLSWSGTAFEYLMPPLLMRTPPYTLLHDACVGAIEEQIAHARRHGRPWGVSECAFGHVGPDGEYHYRAFGTPSLGLQRDPSDDAVVAPYASILALPFRPRAVVENLHALRRQGARGLYGMIDAIDYTPERVPLGQRARLVRTYMAHHQGMILIALGNTLAAPGAPDRFHADPRIAAAEPLLYERAPISGPLVRPLATRPPVRPTKPSPTVEPWSVPLRPHAPLLWQLSNGRYHLLVDDRGAGRSAWHEVALGRWRADATLPTGGSWTYVQDLDQKRLWSVSAEPCGAADGEIEVESWPHMVRFRRIAWGIRTTMDVTVDPQRDVELCRIELHELEGRRRRLALTRCAEPVLATAGEDLRHPAFTKLFVEASAPSPNALMLRHRRRSPKDPSVSWLHQVIAEHDAVPRVSVETERERFLGRWGSYAAPAALMHHGSLAGVTEAPLDPIVALRDEVDLEAHGTRRIAFLASAGETDVLAEEALAPLLRWDAVDHAFARAAEHAKVELERLHLDGRRWQVAQRLQAALVYPRPAAAETVAPASAIGMAGLWRFGISGDLPVLLVRLRDLEVDALVATLLQAHAFGRGRTLEADLVLLNEHDDVYRQVLGARLRRLLRAHHADRWLDRAGGVHLLTASNMSNEEIAFLLAAARVVLDSASGSVDEQLARLEAKPPDLPQLPVERAREPGRPVALEAARLAFDNGWGGFADDGAAYFIRVDPKTPTPAPWANVLANERFGTLVTEAGSSTTWCLNSGENRLTPWPNDPLLDPSGEALYLRDEETAAVWTPTPRPAPAEAPYRVRHDAASTTFELVAHDLIQRMRVFVPPDAPVKLVSLELQDRSGRPRRVTATYAVDWVLGTVRDATQGFVASEYAAEANAVLAVNPLHPEHAARVAFLASDRPPHGVTCDRHEFYGAGGREFPAALARVGLRGRVEAGYDPMAALQVHLDVPAGGHAEALFVLGQGDDRANAIALARRFTQANATRQQLSYARRHWDELLGRLQVRTPDPALDVLVNGWLLHQTLSCRIWGRTATYQSSGAFGFRDQLQDVLALLHAAPNLAREHLLLAASRQFPEGDVLHWWHPPRARGVRTRISDDLVWLPYATATYVEATADDAVLDEGVSFLAGAPLAESEHERYAEFAQSEERATLLEHGLRALERAWRLGPHGLPLIGTGDWNDGFDRVGHGGRGESVWLAWFLVDTMRRFAPLCRLRGLEREARTLEERAVHLIEAIEAGAWDEDRYLRAFYDDGAPLGARGAAECAIDVVAQAWAVLSGGARD